MRRLAFDLETNGLLDELDTIHSLCIQDVDTGETWSCHDHGGLPTISDGLFLLAEADVILGHNIIKFDIPAINKARPGWASKARVRDTLVLSRLQRPDLMDRDVRREAAGKLRDMPKHLKGSHSLQAWGFRLQNLKDDYSGGWEQWSPDMQEYCEQDVAVTAQLFKLFEAEQYSDEAVELEHRVAWIIARQERFGFGFDRTAAEALYLVLKARSEELEERLKDAFPPWTVCTGTMIPKRDNKTLGYKQGVPVTKYKEVLFNPSSRIHIERCLRDKYGWEPAQLTESGRAKIDDAILNALPYPEAKALAEFFMLEKRLGQISDGKNAWYRLEKRGRIHGSVNSNGAVTGRMTHARPNMAQVPAVGKPYGYECRSCFIAPPGKVLVGCDASGLELRMLAHYMAKYDGGKYAEAVLGDVHWENTKGLGLVDAGAVRNHDDPEHTQRRNVAKTFIYAFLYGAGDVKIEKVVSKFLDGPGGEIKAQFLQAFPALDRLLKNLKGLAKRDGFLPGLDGRKLHVRSQHAALNTLLQGGGALVMKRALVILDDWAQAHWVPGKDYEFVANVHDEFQIEATPECAEWLLEWAPKSITAAGESFDLRCRLDGEAKAGRTWADTH